MAPVNVLHLTLSMGAGGIEKLILTMARYLDTKRFNMSVCCLDEGGVLLEEVEALGCDTFVMSRKGGYDLGLIIRLTKYLRDKKIAVLNTHNEAANFYGSIAGLLARTPVIVNTEHSRHYIDGHWRRRIEKRLLSLITDRNITVSDELRDQSIAIDKISKNKLQVIMNGIDLSKYSSESYLKKRSNLDSFRESHRIDDTSKVIGIIGRLDPVKNHELLFESIKYLSESVEQKIDLLVVGDGSRKKYLEGLARQLQLKRVIHFLGYRRDIPEILKELDVLVLCSHSEGLPLTLLEAMAAKVPVVVTQGANKSGIIRHGKNGLVAEPTVISLATMIEKLLKEREIFDEMVCSANEIVNNRYEIMATVDKYQVLYSELVSQYKKYKSGNIAIYK